MELRPAMPSDVEEVAKTSISRGAKDGPNAKAWCEKLGLNPDQNWTYALEHNGAVLGVGGFTLSTDKETVWVWADLAQMALLHTRFIYRLLSSWLSGWCKEKGFKKLVAAIDVNFPEGRRLAEHLGFEQDSVMPGFYERSAAYLYVKTIEA